MCVDQTVFDETTWSRLKMVVVTHSGPPHCHALEILRHAFERQKTYFFTAANVFGG
jgi:hypothetical protein